MLFLCNLQRLDINAPATRNTHTAHKNTHAALKTAIIGKIIYLLLIGENSEQRSEQNSQE